MIILFNPTNSEIELMNQGIEIKIPANAEFMVTEEDAEFVKKTLGFIKTVGAKDEPTIPAIEDVIEEEDEVVEEEVVVDAEDESEEVSEEAPAKTSKAKSNK